MFLGNEEPEALLADASKCAQYLQPPTTVDAMLDAVAVGSTGWVTTR